MRSDENGSTVVTFSSILYIQNSIFSFNKGLHGGVFHFSNRSEVNLVSNIFLANEAMFGGVIKFDNISKIKIKSNDFYFNKAIKSQFYEVDLGKGGCINIDNFDTQSGISIYDIVNNTFIMNGAEVGGIFYIKRPIEKFNVSNVAALNVFDKNKARLYGNAFASPGIEAIMIKGQYLNSIQVNKADIEEKIEFSSSLTNCLVQILAVDDFGQITLGESYFQRTTIKTYSDFDLEFSLYNSFPCLASFIPFPSIPTLSRLMTKKIEININTSLFTNKISVASLKNKNVNISLSLRKCGKGEYFDLKSFECLYCEANFYSFEYDFIYPSSCKSCNSEPFFCYGGFNHSPKAGYWRNHEQSINFIRCPYPFACLGDSSFIDNTDYQQSILLENYENSFPLGKCAFGFSGILCNQCIKNFAKTGGVRCVPCSGGLNIFLMCIKVLIRVILYYYLIYKAFMMCLNVKKKKLPVDLVYSNFLLKMMVLHLQFLKSFLTLPFFLPSMITEIFNYLSFSISSGADKVLSLECFLNLSNGMYLYVYSILKISAPLLVAASLWLLLRRMGFFEISDSPIKPGYKKNSKISHHLMFLPYLFIISLIVSYDEIISILIRSFSSINISDEATPVYHLVGNFEIQIDSDTHKSWMFKFAIPACILIGVIIPTLIIYKIKKAQNQGKLNSEEILLEFGYFYFAYEDKYRLYESAYILRKIFIIVMDTFFIKVFSLTKIYDPSTFTIIICFFNTGLTYIVINYKHYNNELYPFLNKMEILSVLSQALTAWIGSLLLSFDYANKSELFIEVVTMIALIIGGIINIMVVIIWILLYWRLSIKSKLTNALHKIHTSVNYKLSPRPSSFRTSLTKINDYQYQNKPSFKIDTGSMFSSSQKLPSINDEEKEDLFLPPNYSSRFSKGDIIQPIILPIIQPDKNQENFLIIIDSATESTYSIQMSSLWNIFKTSPLKKRNNFTYFIKVIDKTMEKSIDCSYCSKQTKRNNFNSFLQVDIDLQVNQLNVKEITVAHIHNKEFFISFVNNEYNTLNSFLMSYYKNTKEMKEIPGDEASTIFQILCQKRLKYTSNSKVLVLQLIREKILIQIVRSFINARDNQEKELFYYREIKNDDLSFYKSYGPIYKSMFPSLD